MGMRWRSKLTPTALFMSPSYKQKGLLRLFYDIKIYGVLT